MAESTRRAWHRLFGIGLADLFVGSGWRVELEKRLALRSQIALNLLGGLGYGRARRDGGLAGTLVRLPTISQD